MRMFVFILIGFFPQFFTVGQEDSVHYEYLHKVVSFLASDSLKGRETGSLYETVAADFIFSELKKNKGCRVKKKRFQFVHDSITYNSQNIIGFINNRKKQTIVISAHYDHIGCGGKLSLSAGSRSIHNGADDNASGVAILLSLASRIEKNLHEYNFLFLAHSGHELGLYGSNYFLSKLKRKYKSISLFVNFDMVGRLSPEGKLYYEYFVGKENFQIFEGTAGLRCVQSTRNRLMRLDTKWFVQKNISSITFSTGLHIDYHKPTDDVKYINFTGMRIVENQIFKWLTSGVLLRAK